MEYQREEDKHRSRRELARLEQEIHNAEYELPNDVTVEELKIDMEEMWHVNDHCYLKGRALRGYRNRRLFELIDFDDLEGKRVLDAGCGNGRFAVMMAMHGAKVVGVDFSEEGVRYGRQMAAVNNVSENINFSTQDLSSLALGDEQFDLIVTKAVLHHALKYPGVKEEIFRVLRPGGRLIYSEGLRRNPVFTRLRLVYRNVTDGSPKGDVDITLEDLDEFAEGHEWVHSESFCLLLGLKKFVAKVSDEPGVAMRGLFYILKRADDVLLNIAPGLEKQCLETVGVIRKH